MSGNGGDVTFQPGKGDPPGVDGSFIWLDADGGEVMRLDPDGKFRVFGVAVEQDRLVYAAFKNWLACSTAALGAGATARLFQRIVPADDESPPPFQLPGESR